MTFNSIVLGEKTLRRYDGDGKVLEQAPAGAIGVHDPGGGATGLFEDADGSLYVEESLQDEGRRVVRPAAGGDVLAGQPSADGGSCSRRRSRCARRDSSWYAGSIATAFSSG